MYSKIWLEYICGSKKLIFKGNFTSVFGVHIFLSIRRLLLCFDGCLVTPALRNWLLIILWVKVALNKKCTYLAAADDSGETKVCWSYNFQENISGNQSTKEFYINNAFHALNLTVSLLNATGSKGFSTNTIRHERELPIPLRVSTFRQLVLAEFSLLPQNVALLY